MSSADPGGRMLGGLVFHQRPFRKYTAFFSMKCSHSGGHLVLGGDRVDRASLYTRVDAPLGVDVKLLRFREPGSSAVGWMQSTGQTSVQLASLTPMHGSLIT